MPEHLRALVVILFLAVAVFWLAEKPLCAAGIAQEDYKRRRNLWFAVTLSAFLAHNFWLYCLLVTTALLTFGRRERNPLALYFVLLFAVPPFGAQVPGLGIINYFFELNHIRLLNLVLLLPLALHLVADRQEAPGRVPAAMLMLLGYLGLLAGLTALLNSFTGTMRTVFMLALDVWLPFYVASKSLRNTAMFRDAMTSFTLGGLLLAAIGVFEFAKGWLLYATLDRALGLSWDMGSYLFRGEGGALRALASTGHSIVLGYVLLVALAFHLQFVVTKPVTSRGVGLLLLLAAGLIAPLARGPWVGAAAMLVLTLALGSGGARRLLRLGLAGVATFGVLFVSPWGDAILDYLPFIGSVDAGSVDYRARLVEVSLGVLWNSPVFGVWEYMLSPAMEEMRQGQGIIDMVNSYLGVALGTGLVGLSLFAGTFVFAAWSTFRLRASSPLGTEADAVGRSLLGALLGVLVTIGTVSSINAVPTVYWILAGMLVAYSSTFGVAPQPRNEPRPRDGASARPTLKPVADARPRGASGR